MKHLLSLLFLIISLSANAQRDVTKFLGIPVDGSKSAMIQKLKAKGFVYNQSKDILTGQFNDCDVQISVVTNNNKVSRIAIVDRFSSDEADIKIRFNTLCRQFEKNKKYISFDNQTIPDNEDISYNMLVNKKRYEASFYQMPASCDTLYIANKFEEKIRAKYSEEELSNLSEKEKEEIKESMSKDLFLELLEKTPVWFMIDEEYGKYKIIMFYDNLYNKSDGSDL